MGVAQNALLGAGAAIGVSANKLATGLQGMTSESVDAEKNEMMAEKAKMNAEKLKNLKLRNNKLRLQNKALKEKQTLKNKEKPNE